MQVVSPGLVEEQHNVRNRDSHRYGCVHQSGRPVLDDEGNKNVEGHVDGDVKAHKRESNL